MRSMLYAAPLLLGLSALAAIMAGGIWTWFLPVFTFMVLPVLDQVSPGTTANLSVSDEVRAQGDRLHDLAVWSIVPLQLVLVATFCWRIAGGDLAVWELVGLVGTMAIGCGVYGINVGHELGHRRSTSEQRMAKVLLITSLYGHFFVEHNRGHHRRIGTPDDPATSRRGESVYAFWVRSIVGSWRSAWELENRRLERLGLPWWSPRNELVRITAAEVALCAVIGVAAGPVALGGFVVAAFGGALMLETVNYLEHYGLTRAITERGVHERVQPHHSWNSNRPAGRIFLHELTRHADHHAHPTRPYQVLRHHDEAPQLPAGYPAMMIASLVPPLFDRIMAPELEAWEARYGSARQAA